jgi:hypothetical protein
MKSCVYQRVRIGGAGWNRTGIHDGFAMAGARFNRCVHNDSRLERQGKRSKHSRSTIESLCAALERRLDTQRPLRKARTSATPAGREKALPAIGLYCPSRMRRSSGTSGALSELDMTSRIGLFSSVPKRQLFTS